MAATTSSSTKSLPNMALSKEGGGQQSLDPSAQTPGRTLNAFYEIELIADGINNELILNLISSLLLKALPRFDLTSTWLH